LHCIYFLRARGARALPLTARPAPPQLIFEKYEDRLTAACNITTTEALEIMLFRYMNKPMHFAKFGKVPGSRGVESVESILSRIGHDMCKPEHAGTADGDNYVDGAAAAARLSKKASGHSYRVAPWACVNAGGNVWRFGVELRFLMLARAIFGTSHGVSQTSVQKVWDHMTRQMLLERIPATIFPYSTYVTTMPDPDGLALTISTIRSHAQRPSTMIRPLPESAVVDKNSSSIPGLLPCRQMPEDITIVSAQWRLAERMSDKDVTVSHSDVHVEELSTPPIPHDTWVSLDLVQRAPGGGGGDAACALGSAAPYASVAIFIHAGSQKVSWAVQTARSDPVQLRRHAEAFGLSAALASDKLAAWRAPLTLRTSPGIAAALAATPATYTRFHPIFHRRGVLVAVPVVGALTAYLVLLPWDAEDLQGVLPGPGPFWFNPGTMGYLAGAEEAPDGDNYSQRLWPCLAEVTEPEQRAASARPAAAAAAARRDVLFTAVQNTLGFTAADAGGDDELVDEIQRQLAVYTEAEPVLANLSSARVDQYLVKVGEPLLLDAMHPVLQARFAASARLAAPLDALKKGATLAELVEHAAGAGVHPVVECMLLYELPASIAPPCADAGEFLVWVGVRQIHSVSKHVDAIYLAVPSRALVPRSRLEGLGLLPALFDVYCE